ncbi:MAG: hypothetical protein WA842_07280 [Croceibacterium sp.]
MIRQLLALIALITGLAAVAEPAQARYADVQAVSQAVQRDAGCKQGVVARQTVAGQLWGRAEQTRSCPRPQIVVIVPPVMLKADRAHE